MSIMINLHCVELHPLLQLPGDVLVLPLSQVGDDDSRVEGARVSPHPQLLDGLLLEVQESYIVILLKTISYLINCHHIINIPHLHNCKQLKQKIPTWLPAPRIMPLADAESQSSEKAAACPGLRLVS